MVDLSNILSNGPEPNEAALKRYLDGTASDAERFAIENQLFSNGCKGDHA